MAGAADTQFGKYKLLAKIAAGGMAIAYRAEMTGAAGVKKRVVLKVIHPHLAQEKNFIAMFISEAKVAASLTHGNIAQVFDFGQIDGRYYLAMEEVIGQPLSKVQKVMREKGYARLPVPLALQVAIGVLDGLHYAHTRKEESGKTLNLVHRDVTPDNVLLSYEGEVKVVDFGIAKTNFSVDQTEAGMVRGKYPYLSPEQASGNRELDARADIWAAAVQLYDLVCGRRPYEGEFLTVMREIVGPNPVPTPRSIVPSMDPELELMILNALKKERTERYSTAREFSLALQGYWHSKFPTSTRQDVQFLLATLFPADAAKEGADVTVPPGWAQQLSSVGAQTAPSNRLPPPVATGAGASHPPSVPRISMADASRIAPPPPPLDEESTAAGVELEAAVRELASSDDEEEATLSGIQVEAPRVSPKPTAPSKKTDSGKRLKGIDTGSESSKRLKSIDSVSESSKRLKSIKAPPEETRAAPSPTNNEPATLSEIPRALIEAALQPEAPIPAPATKVAQGPVSNVSGASNAVTQEKSISSSEALVRGGKGPRRTSLIIGVVGLAFAMVAIGAFAMWKSSTTAVDPPKVAGVPLWVKSSPPGAAIRIDGQAGGKTPNSANVSPGEHAVTLELEGHALWSTKVVVKAGEPFNVQAALEPLAVVPGTAPEAQLDAGEAVAVAVPVPVVAVPPAEPQVDAGAAVAVAVPVPAAPPALTDAAHFAQMPKRFHTLRLQKNALPLAEASPLRIELSPKRTYQLATSGSVTLSEGHTTNALLYYLEGDGPFTARTGVLTPKATPIKNATAIRVFVLDGNLEDNAGTMRITSRVSQYEVEKVYTYDAKAHGVRLGPEHSYRMQGMAPDSRYLIFSRRDMPQLSPGKEGVANQVLCLSDGDKPLNKRAHFIPIGAMVALDENGGGLTCTFLDEKLDDNSGSIELDIVDEKKAANEGVDPKKYQPQSKWSP